MKLGTLAAWVACLCLAGPLAGGAQTPTGDGSWSRAPGGLLPLQDRVGNPQIAAAVEAALRGGLAENHTLVDAKHLRDAQRRLRLRDTSQASPDVLARLGEQTAAEWFFSATLHEALKGRATRASRAYTLGTSGRAAEPVPQIILSARVVRLSAGAPALGWAGFEAASGLDDRRLLGLGVVSDPEQLALAVTRRLVDAFEQDLAGDTAWPGARPADGGYLRRPIEAGGTIAVVPFHSVTTRDATLAGEAVTELAYAVLHRSGARLVLPGLVNEIQRERGALLRGEVDAEARDKRRRLRLLRGEVDAETRQELHRRGAELILTGTVEAWEVRGGSVEPEPHVAFSARLIDAENGTILWWNGQDRRGWDRSHALGLGRVHASGVLAEEVMSSLIASFLSPRRGANGMEPER